jgi:TolB-like protein/Flp pilus assembly protein TadD
MSPGGDQEYLADGLAEEILNVLACVDGLRVVGRTSSFAFKGGRADLPTIGRKLGVAIVLEGAVRKEGARVRVTADLVRVSDGSRRWSGAYDRDVADVLTAQNEIARAVVEELRLHLVPTAALEQHPEQVAPEVRNAYLLGRAFVRRLTLRDFQRAVEAFEKALRGDPRYAPAWAGLSRALYLTAAAPDAPGDAGDQNARALAASERAIALDPGLAEAYVSRGVILSRVERRWREAGADLQRALALRPGDSGALRAYARYLGSMGRNDEAVRHAQRAADLDPLSAVAWSTLGLLHLRGERTGPAQVALRRSLEILPEQDFAPSNLGIALLLERHPEEALAAFRLSTSEMFRLMGTALACPALERGEEARRALDDLSARFARGAAYQIATVHAWWGEADAAFAWLDRALAQRDTGLSDFAAEPLLRGLRGDARFGQLLQRLGLPAG